MSTLKKFAGQTAIYGISTIAARVLNFFLTPLYTRVYAPRIYGIFTEMYSYASILNAVLSFGMETTFFRYLNKKEGEKEQVYQNAFFVVAGLSLLFLGMSYLFLEDIAQWMKGGKLISVKDYATYIQLFIWIIVIDALSVVPFARLRAEGKPARYAVLKVTNILSFIGLNLVFLFLIPYIINIGGQFSASLASWYRPNWIGYVFIANLVASLLTLILLTPELLKLKFAFSKTLLIEMLAYSWPILIANLSFIINENIDKIFLSQLLPPNISTTQVGIYGGCCKLAVFLSIFIMAFRLGAEPFFFNHAKNANAKDTYALIMKYFIMAITLIFVGIVANIELLKYFISNPDYWVGLNVVPILLFGYISLGIYMNLSIWYKLSDQTKYGLYISGVGAILTIALNIWLIPIFGYLACAWISLIAYSSMMILSYILGQINYPIPYAIRNAAQYLILSVILVWISFIFFKRDIIIGNLLFISYGLIILFLERKQLKKLRSKI